MGFRREVMGPPFGRSESWFRVAVLLVVLLAVAGLAPREATAQTPTRDQPFPTLQDARRVGPFLFKPAFSIENLGYDDNIFLVSPDQEKQSSFVARLGPDLRLQSRLGRTVAITLRDQLMYEWFAAQSSLSSFNNLAEGQFDLSLGRFLLTTKAANSSAKERPNFEEDRRTKRRDERWEQGLRLFLSPSVDLGVSVGSDRQTYRRDQAESGIQVSDPRQNNRKRTTQRVDLGWRPRRSIRAFVTASTSETDFDLSARVRDEGGALISVSRDLDERRALAGLELSSTYLTGTIRLGETKLDPKSSFYQSYRGLASESEVIYRPTGRTRISATFQRQPRSSLFTQDKSYYIETTTGLTLDSFLGNLVGVQAGYTRARLDYTATSELKDTDPDEKDIITNTYGGVLLRSLQGAVFGLRVGRRERKSDFGGASDEQTYIQTTVSFDF